MIRSVAAMLCVFVCQSCNSTPKPVEACLNIQASPNLNLYDGNPHAVTLYLYPLKSALGFQQMAVDDLLEGASIPNGEGTRVPVTINPGEARSLTETYSPATRFIGVIVDYYRAPGDPEGARKLIVEASCGRGRPSLVLSPRNVLAN